VFVDISIYGSNNDESQFSRRVYNTSAFAKAYGYIKYFHPLEKIDWDCFLLQGIKQVEVAKSNDELIEILNQHFNKLSPYIKFSKEKSVLLPSVQSKKVYYNEHNGNGEQYVFHILMKLFPIYSSKTKSIKFSQVDHKLTYTNSSFQLSDSIYLKMSFITPKIKSQQDVDKCKAPNNASYMNDILCVIKYWNVIRFFYPYWYHKRNDWDATLVKAIEHCYNSKDLYALFIEMNANLNDGHAGIEILNKTYFQPQIYPDRLSGKIIIKNCYNCDTLNINTGEEILSINNISAVSYYDSVFNKVPNIKYRTREAITNRILFNGDKYSPISLKIQKSDSIKDLNLNRTLYYAPSTPITKDIQLIKEGIYYLNASFISYKQIMKFLNDNNDVKCLIFDYRYYPGDIVKINRHFIKEDVSSQYYLYPIIKYPPELGIIEYDTMHFYLKPHKNKLDILPIFLVDANTASKGETHISLVKEGKVGFTVGENTGGVNGDVSFYKINDTAIASFSGAIVLNQDFSEFQNVGIKPDIEVQLTQEKFLKNNDPILEEAIKFIDEYFKKEE
jgi:hypothetical protein